MIAGFIAPTSGEIRIAGQRVTGRGLDRGMVFQDFAQLFPWRTALGNVCFGLEMKGVAKTQREEIAREQLSLVKLEKFERSYPHHLTRKTVVYVTHNVAEAVYLADRVVVMTPHPGMLKAEVPIHLARPRDPLSIEFLEHQKALLQQLAQQSS
jgi:NitT/TauT family transport system ATP-binding protein